MKKIFLLFTALAMLTGCIGLNGSQGMIGPAGPQGEPGTPGTVIVKTVYAGILDGKVTIRDCPLLNGESIYNVVMRDISGCNSGAIGAGPADGAHYNLNLRDHKITIYDPNLEWFAYEIVVWN